MTKKKRIVIGFILAIGLISIPIIRSGYFFVRALKPLINRWNGEAVWWLEKSIKANPYFLEPYIGLAIAYTEWGSRSLHYKEYDEGGFIKLKTGTLGKAEQILKTALRRFPYHIYRDDMQYMLGWIYDEDSTNSGCVWDRKKAIEGYRELIRKYPKSRYVQEARERIKSLQKDTLLASQ